MSATLEETFHANDKADIPIPKTGMYLQDRQVREMEGEVSKIEKMLGDPKGRIEDRGSMNTAVRHLRNMIDTQAPPDTTPTQRDAMSRRAAELKEKIRQDMCSQEELRKSPPGAVAKELAFLRKHKRNIVEWKNIMRALHKGDPNPDVSNMELWRPVTSTLNMDNARIPGKTFVGTHPSPEYRDGWEQTFGNGNAASAEDVQALLSRLNDLEKRLAEKAEGPEPTLTNPRDTRPSRVHDVVAMRCGVQKSARGTKMHERHCEACQAKIREEQGAA